MQFEYISSWNERADDFRCFVHSGIVPVTLLLFLFLIISVLPAIASKALATEAGVRAPDGGATAEASAKILKPFKMTSAMLAGTAAFDFGHTIIRRTTLRSCHILLGRGSAEAEAPSCELRLVELQ